MDEIKFQRYPSQALELYSRDDKNFHRLMSGKALFTPEESRFSFVESPKRDPRSKLILASSHASLRLRPTGKFSISVVFDRDEKYINEALLSEVRGLVKATKDLQMDDEKSE